MKELVESLVQNGHDGLAQRAGFTEKEVVETFDQDDEEGDEEVEMVRNSVDNTDLVIFLSEVEVKYMRYLLLQCTVPCAILKLMLFLLAQGVSDISSVYLQITSLLHSDLIF